ncbi:Callose synthase 10, partial [Mucuna pruriens]
MATARENWERLVRATLKRDKQRNAGQGHARVPSGIAGAVPPSLSQTTNVDLILQAADEIQSEDPNVARICKCSIGAESESFCEFQFSMNFEQWCIKMGVIFGFQEVLEIVKNNIQEVEVGDTKGVQEDCKALFLIHQCVDSTNFEKISSSNPAKET